ncbi:hypothetical protein PR202_ga21800 [Eleusine coracana subsp. coracana]|uniref:Transmembrane protein n=1 Tax=Eleusine coracana subsp. coracana TaxID=191504 RepID=A0AAV5D2B4_ELECO|nr:hypothetical protein PR202_ga21800 [Eleusine coracana subsp. coracana]
MRSYLFPLIVSLSKRICLAKKKSTRLLFLSLSLSTHLVLLFFLSLSLSGSSRQGVLLRTRRGGSLLRIWADLGWGAAVQGRLRWMALLQRPLVAASWLRVTGEVRQGINSLVILGAWALWRHRNNCVINGVSPSIATLLILAGDDKCLWLCGMAGAKAITVLPAHGGVVSSAIVSG